MNATMQTEDQQNMSVEYLLKKHHELYEALRKSSPAFFEQSDNVECFVDDVKKLLAKMAAVASDEVTIQEYSKLTDIKATWERLLSSKLNISMTTSPLPSPKQLKIIEPEINEKAMRDTDVRAWISEQAYSLGLCRIKEDLMKEVSRLYLLFPSTWKDREQDWYYGCVCWAVKVLDGKIDLRKQIWPDSYHHLEYVWLNDVKKLKAYFNWIKRDRPFDISGGINDYFQACNDIRDRFVNKTGIQSSKEGFNEVKKYLTVHFPLLQQTSNTSTMSVDIQSANITHAIQRKAYRLYESTGELDESKNWSRAEKYVRQFYGNIISAVDGNSSSVRQVLDAFRFSEEADHRYSIVNCFEAAVAIYFLSANSITSVEMESRIII
jgi:hypothetical protein